jgi:hypothetical protein
MSEPKVNRCVLDMAELVKVSVTNDLLAQRTMGNVTLDDESLQAVLLVVQKSVTDAASKTVTRISNIFADQ